jgi:hypothetical protein
MFGYQVREFARIDAPASQVYAILADYRVGHPRILPEEFFSGFVVEDGGVGEGTVIRFGMRVLGTARNVRARVAEPQAGRTLTETDLESGAVTTFTVTPVGTASEVSISTELRVQGGAMGWLDRFVITSFLRRVYVRKLQLLAAAAVEPLPADPAPS